MLLGFADRLAVLHPLAGDCRGDLAAQHRGLYQFLLNKWYFDELYDFLFVRPAKRLGTLPVEEAATAGSSTASARTASRRASSTSPTASSAADRLPLPLRLRHADRRRRARHLDDARERLLMTDWPILSTVTFLPLVGVLLILFDPRRQRRAARRNIRAHRAV